MSITDFAISMGGSKIAGEKPSGSLILDFTLPVDLAGTGVPILWLEWKLDGVSFNPFGTPYWGDDMVWVNKTTPSRNADPVLTNATTSTFSRFAQRGSNAAYGLDGDECELTINFTAAQINAWDSAGSVTVKFYIRTGTSTYWYTDGQWQTAFTISAATGAACFLGPTKVKTDQGLIAFNQLTKYNTISNLKIKKVTKMYNSDDNLIFIKKHAFGKNIPNKNTYIGRNHGIYIDGKLVRARDLINKNSVQQHVRRVNDMIYNVLLEKYSIMYINNMPCETLNENDPAMLKYIK